MIDIKIITECVCVWVCEYIYCMGGSICVNMYEYVCINTVMDELMYVYTFTNTDFL